MLHESDDTVLGSLPAVVDAYVLKNIPWRGREVKILCTGPTGSTALAALINMYSLTCHPVLESLELPILTEDVIKMIAKLLVRESLKLQTDINESERATLVNVVDNPGTEFCISPTLLGPLNFDYSNAVFLFGILHFKLLHGWVLDSATPIYQEAKVFTRSGLSVYLTGIEDDEGQADNVMLVKGLLHAAENHQMTKCGFTSLFHEIADGELAIIFCYNRFNLVQRHADNLLMVETDIIVRKNFPDVQWRLFDGESLEDSLYLTKSFTLVNGHDMTAKAHDWAQSHLSQGQKKKKKRREKKLAEAASSQAATPDHIVQSTAEVPSSITAERTLPPAGMKSEAVPSVSADQIVKSTGVVPSSIPGTAESTLPPAEMKSEAVPSSIPGTAERTLPPAEMKSEAVPSVSADQIVKSTGVVPSSISVTDEETLLAENKSGVHAKSADKVLIPELGTLTSDFSGGKVVASFPNLDSDSSGDTSIKMSSDETDKRTEEPEAKIAFDMDFLEFLIDFRLNGIDYFKGILEAYKVTHKPWFFVPYEFILQHNERLALNIQDNYPRICEELRESVVKYFKRNGLSCIDMKLKILGLPKAKSTQMFEDFVGSIKLHEVYQISDSER